MVDSVQSPVFINAHQVDEAIDRMIDRNIPDGPAYDAIDPAELADRVHAATSAEASAVVQSATDLEEAVARETQRVLAELVR